MPAASATIRHDYQSSEEDDLITVTFDPKFDDLDAVYVKAQASYFTSWRKTTAVCAARRASSA
ncbi:MAG TPA: hypothetical protein VK308_07115 [Pyrinomonadaceae bacterium]|nr:hypothetical protein [Pyrinomonadaceae bacterium]